MRSSFRGGIHFPKALQSIKETALSRPIEVVTPPLIRFPLSNFTPCVTNGSTVAVGDRLGIDKSGTLPPFHSGLSGTVQLRDDELTVVSDGQQRRGHLLTPLAASADREAILRRMYDGGLVGMGGAGFPTHRKYRNLRATHLLVNACECEAYLAADGRLAIEQQETLREGIAWLMKAAVVAPSAVYLCAKTEGVLEALRHIAHGTLWRVVPVSDRYPQGSEKQLIYTVLKREIPHGTVPSKHGIVVSNIATAAAMADAARGLPLTHRVITVSGVAASPCNLLTPIGTPLRFLASYAEPLISGRRAHLVLGGGMTGDRVASPDSGLPKHGTGILILPADRREEAPCIRCGRCVRVCPSGLMPFLIEAAARQEDTALCTALKPDACIACGCCSYVCPAHRELAAHIIDLHRKGGPT